MFSRLKTECPFCRSKRIRRQPRRGFMQRHVWPMFMGFPFHCGSCQRNFVLLVGRNIKQSDKAKVKRKSYGKGKEMEVADREV